jgi:hypothetical protein
MRKWVLQIARTTLVDYGRLRFQKGGSTLSLEELVRAGGEVCAEEERGRRQSNAVARSKPSPAREECGSDLVVLL